MTGDSEHLEPGPYGDSNEIEGVLRRTLRQDSGRRTSLVAWPTGRREMRKTEQSGEGYWQSCPRTWDYWRLGSRPAVGPGLSGLILRPFWLLPPWPLRLLRASSLHRVPPSWTWNGHPCATVGWLSWPGTVPGVVCRLLVENFNGQWF